MKKLLLIISILLAIFTIVDCKSIISIAEGQSKGRVYAVIAEPQFTKPPSFYIAHCTHDGAKLNCENEQITVKMK
ncbi:MAG: hypothetical protein MH321_11045 [Leptospiraceae bacterium]|nr:hypothetical protein [Leptospiraceae bacterium]